MKLIKPDYDRRIEIEGVPAPVRRPVDIDQGKTGFVNLRTLRIYQFDPGSAIEGHAEEDEVVMVLLAGSAELTLKSEGSDDISTLLSAEGDRNSACAAYLPPHAAYRLLPLAPADVAYARATPVRSSPAKVFVSQAVSKEDGCTLLLDQVDYAEKLGLRLFRIDAAPENMILGAQKPLEALVHVRNVRPTDSATIKGDDGTVTTLETWDTVAIAAGERPMLRLAAGSSALVLIILAS